MRKQKTNVRRRGKQVVRVQRDRAGIPRGRGLIEGHQLQTSRNLYVRVAERSVTRTCFNFHVTLKRVRKVTAYLQQVRGGRQRIKGFGIDFIDTQIAGQRETTATFAIVRVGQRVKRVTIVSIAFDKLGRKHLRLRHELSLPVVTAHAL